MKSKILITAVSCLFLFACDENSTAEPTELLEQVNQAQEASQTQLTEHVNQAQDTIQVQASEQVNQAQGASQIQETEQVEQTELTEPKTVSDMSDEPEVSDYPVEIASVSYATCVLTNEDKLYCWGETTGTTEDINQPEFDILDFTPMPTDFTNPRNLQAGSDHFCMETDEGVLCWGSNYSGQSDVPDDLGQVTKLALAEHQTCAVKQGGHLTCWGLNLPMIPEGIDNVAEIWGGNTDYCFISDGELFCPDLSLETKNLMPDFSTLPTQMVFAHGMGCAVIEHEVICWGATEGQERIFSALKLQVLAAVGLFACALEDMRLNCWGSPWDEENHPAFDIDESIQGKIKDVAVGQEHVCAIVSNVVICWGDDTRGFEGMFSRGSLDVPPELQAD